MTASCTRSSASVWFLARNLANARMSGMMFRSCFSNARRAQRAAAGVSAKVSAAAGFSMRCSLIIIIATENLRRRLGHCGFRVTYRLGRWSLDHCQGEVELADDARWMKRDPGAFRKTFLDQLHAQAVG